MSYQLSHPQMPIYQGKGSGIEETLQVANSMPPEGIETLLPQSNYNPLNEGMASITYTQNIGGLAYSSTISGPIAQIANMYSAMLSLSNKYQAPREGGLEKALETPKEQIIFQPKEFVTQPTPITHSIEEILPEIKEAFRKTANKELSENISIALCTKEELKQAHNFYGGEWNENIQGFCINNPKGISHVFVKKGELAHVMLTIGHELGHLQSHPLNEIEEEAKAYAFSLAWMRVIREENIANLRDVLVTDNPARNGLHNIAFDFVCSMLRKGKEALEVFESLIAGNRIETFI